MAIGIATTLNDGAKLKVIGVGGGGGNAVNNMINDGLEGLEFIAANTDKQALDQNFSKIKIQLGKELTRGLGAGGNPEVGKAAAEESASEIKEILKDSDMVFVTAGMGGGTGTGAAPVIAKIAQDLGALVVGIVTQPFSWEGRKRESSATDGVQQLRNSVDALIVIQNQRLLQIIDSNVNFRDAFRKVDDVLYNATKGIAQLISCHGIINVDFADVKAVMKGMGDAIMGIGYASGDNRAVVATQEALNSPLLDGVSVRGSKGVLVNVTGGKNLSMHEISAAVSTVQEATGEEANIIHGVSEDESLGDRIMVTVVATGFINESAPVNPVRKEVPAVKVEKNVVTETVNNPTRNFPTPVREIPSVRQTNNIPEPSYSRQIAYPFNRAPRGENELKGFDKPTIQRLGIRVNNLVMADN